MNLRNIDESILEKYQEISDKENRLMSDIKKRLIEIKRECRDNLFYIDDKEFNKDYGFTENYKYFPIWKLEVSSDETNIHVFLNDWEKFDALSPTIATYILDYIEKNIDKYKWPQKKPKLVREEPKNESFPDLTESCTDHDGIIVTGY